MVLLRQIDARSGKYDRNRVTDFSPQGGSFALPPRTLKEAGGTWMANQEQLDILKQGVEAWNEWRQKHEDIIPDLRGAQLSGSDLRNADLNEAHLNSADLSGA